MSPRFARHVAIVILAVGVAGVVALYLQLNRSIRHQQRSVQAVQRNIFEQLLETLSLEAQAYEANARNELEAKAAGHPDIRLPTANALTRGDIDGLLVVDGGHSHLYSAGVPISPEGFANCLRENVSPSGIHTCPVSRHTVIYSIVTGPASEDAAYSVVFYREVLPEFEVQISRISGAPVRFVNLDGAVPVIPDHGNIEEFLNNVDGVPLVRMASYFPLTTRNWSRLFLAVTVLIIVLLAVLQWMLIGFSRTAELTRQVEAKNRELEQLTAQKENLLRVLCHDLGNYLSIVLGNSQLLSIVGQLSERQRGLVNRLQEAVQRQVQIIDRIRQQQALTQGKTVCQARPVPLGDLLAQAQRDFELKLRERDMRLEIAGDPDGMTVLVDPLMFSTSVLNNLISNALKFSPEGSVITLRVSRSGNSHVRLAVEDRGIGIPPALLARIWDATLQTTRKGLRGESGTGFGMPLAKQVVEACGGTIAIESRERDSSPDTHGTSIILDLPLADAQAPT